MAVPLGIPDTPDLEMKTGDLRPIAEAQLVDENGDGVDLTAATEVRFIMRRENGVVEVDAVATIATATTGQVQYAWTSGDTDVDEADYLAEWEVTWDDGDQETYPNDGYNLIRIREDLGGAG